MEEGSEPAPEEVDTSSLDEPKLERTGSSEVVGGKYRLFATLGRGGMADVYLALASGPVGFNKLVVIKKPRDNVVDNPEFMQMFLDEARLSARLTHSNVVQTYEVGAHDSRYFIAMEYLDGQPLNRLFAQVVAAQAKVAPVIWARIVANALLGLHYAHELRDYDGTPIGVIHRDVSPHNLFITYEGEVKVVDFGIAKAMLNATRTASGVLKGKAGYMALEQAMGAQIDRRADLFSVGVVLWELLAERRLFPGTVMEVLYNLMNSRIPNLLDVKPDVPPALADIAMKAVQAKPEDRFQTALEMHQALEMYIHSTGALVQPLDLGALLTTHFRARRDERFQEIQRFMRESTVDSGSIEAGANPSRRHEAVRPHEEGLASVRIAVGSSAGILASQTPLDIEPHSASGGTQLTTAASAGVPALERERATDAAAKARTPRLASLAVVGALVIAATYVATRASSTATSAAAVSTVAASAARGSAATRPTLEEPSSFVIVIDSVPRGARLYDGDVELGLTPIQFSLKNADLRAAPRKYTVRQEGYVSYDLVQGPADENVHVVATLISKPVASAVAAPSPSPPTPTTTPRKRPPRAPPAAGPTSAPSAAPGEIRLDR